jgi:hypothetical protein
MTPTAGTSYFSSGYTSFLAKYELYMNIYIYNSQYMEDGVQSRANRCENCGGQSANERGFPLSNLVFLCQLLSTNVPRKSSF